MRVDSNVVAPSQDYLKEKTINFIMECLEKGDKVNLPPNPVVRYDDDGTLVAIDGHNLLAVRAFRQEQQEVHIAKSADDGLPDTSDANRGRNQDLKDKFEECIRSRKELSSRGIERMSDLVSMYPKFFKETL